MAHELGEAISDVVTSHENMELSYNRLLAAEQVVDARRASYDAGNSTIDALLEAQRRLAQSRIDYFRTRVGHVLAIKNVHLRKGTLLPYNGIHLSEGRSVSMPLHCARERRPRKNRLVDYRMTKPGNFSHGPFSQTIDLLSAVVPNRSVSEPTTASPSRDVTDNGTSDAGQDSADVVVPEIDALESQSDELPTVEEIPQLLPTPGEFPANDGGAAPAVQSLEDFSELVPTPVETIRDSPTVGRIPAAVPQPDAILATEEQVDSSELMDTVIYEAED